MLYSYSKFIYCLIIAFLMAPLCVSSQSWLNNAQAEIELLRMSDFRLKLIDAQQQPVTGAKVAIRMKQHAFKWGTNMHIGYMVGLELQGHPIGSDHPYYNHMLNFNAVTPGNAGKWKFWTVEATREKYLEAMDWLISSKVSNRGHTTIWPSISRWNAVPDTVLNATAIMENGQVIKSKANVVRDIIKGHLEEQLPILANYVYEIDLINELVHEAEIVKDILQIPAEDRPSEHAQWYKWAKAVAPNLPLIANEYDLYQSGNNFHDQFVKYIKDMQSAGAPVDGVGLQGHFFSTVPTYAELKKRLAEVAVLDLPMAITEFDMVHNSYDEMQRVLYSCFSEPLVNGFTMWGAWDGRQWRNNGAMYNLDWSLKESGKAWFDLVKEKWWTDTTCTTAADGEVTIRGFLGDYDLFVTYEDQVYIKSFTLPKDGAELEITLMDSKGLTLPDVKLHIDKERAGYYFNEPVEIGLISSDSIIAVTYYDDLQVITKPAPPFSYTLTRDKYTTILLSAEVEFASGYRIRTAIHPINFSLANAGPRIQQVFPPDGSSLLRKDSLEFFVEAIDPTGDPVRAWIHDEAGTVIARDSTYPFVLPIIDLSPGVHQWHIRVQDDKFGFDERTYQVAIVDGNQLNVTMGTPMSGDDDVEESGDGSITIEGDLDLGDRLNGIRFPFLGLPQDATIDSAYIQFSSQKNAQSGRTVLYFHGEIAAAATPFRNTLKNISQRMRSKSMVRWEPDRWRAIGDQTSVQRTPDISSVLQELTLLPSWSMQSPVHIIIDFEPGLSKRSAFSYDLLKEQAPELTVYFRSDFSKEPPEPPHNFSFTAISEFLGTILWEPQKQNSILGYKVRLAHESDFRITTRPVISVFDLEVGTIYQIQVKTIGELGIESDWSEPFSFQVQTTSNLQEETAIQISAYPNPVKDELHLEGDLDKVVSLQLLQSDGRSIVKKRWTGEGQYLACNNLASGVYILKLMTSEGNTVIRRIVKL